MHYLGQQHQMKHRKPLAKKLIRSRPTLLDRATFITGIIGPFTVLPQIYLIFMSHNARGVSLISWLLMFVITMPWIFYGVVHHDKTITISYILWEIVNVAVIVGVLLYQ